MTDGIRGVPKENLFCMTVLVCPYENQSMTPEQLKGFRDDFVDRWFRALKNRFDRYVQRGQFEMDGNYGQNAQRFRSGWMDSPNSCFIWSDEDLTLHAHALIACRRKGEWLDAKQLGRSLRRTFGLPYQIHLQPIDAKRGGRSRWCRYATKHNVGDLTDTQLRWLVGVERHVRPDFWRFDGSYTRRTRSHGRRADG